MITAQIERDTLVVCAATPDATGQRVPIREVRWMDERSSCALAHAALAPDYLPGEPNADAALPDFRACPNYRAGTCALAHDGAACLFAELPDSTGWATLRQHRRLPDGTVCSAGSYATLLPIITARPSDPGYKALPDGTYCLAEHWASLNAMLTRR